MNQPKDNARNDLRHLMTDRRKLLASAFALAGSGAVATATWGSFSGRTSLAQETDLNPGVATPNPLGPTVPSEVSENAQDWPLPMGDYAGTRAAQDSSINSESVTTLGVAWTFPIEAAGTFGGMTAQPLIIGDTVYVQDMQSNVFALNRANGEVRWEKRYGIPTAGPNGVAVGYGLVFGSLGDTAEMFALDAANGEEVWRVQLSNNAGEGIDIAPLVYDNVVYTSTVPGQSDLFYQGGTKGILFALDAKTGTTLHQWDTTAGEPTGNLRAIASKLGTCSGGWGSGY